MTTKGRRGFKFTTQEIGCCGGGGDGGGDGGGVGGGGGGSGKVGGGGDLGCIFLQESSGFLHFPFLWRFFHRNHDSCSAITFSGRHQETCLYGAYVESYVGYQFVRQKQSAIQFYGTLRWLLSTTIAAPPPPLLCRHCCAAATTATPIALPLSPLPLLHHLSHCCAA
jgi:hypothetical protein